MKIKLFHGLAFCLSVFCVLLLSDSCQSEEKLITKKGIIKINDKLGVQVRNEADLSGIFEVKASGKIDYPFLGEIKAEGLTLDEFKGFLIRKLGQDYIVSPEVNVEFKERPSSSVTIVGQVGKPGSYLLAEDLTLLQLISQAGGLMSQTGGFIEDPAQIRVKIIRSGDGKKRDFLEMELEPVMKGDIADPKLEIGDMVFLYSVRGKKMEIAPSVSIMGQVSRPGNYAYTDSMMFIRLIAEAGGFTSVASTGNIRLIRYSKKGEEKIFYVNAAKIMDGKAEDIKLEEGDLIVVPESFF